MPYGYLVLLEGAFSYRNIIKSLLLKVSVTPFITYVGIQVRIVKIVLIKFGIDLRSFFKDKSFIEVAVPGH